MVFYPFELLYKNDNFFVLTHFKCGYSTIYNTKTLKKVYLDEDNINENLEKIKKSKVILLYRNVYLRNISYFFNYIYKEEKNMYQYSYLLETEVDKIILEVKKDNYIEAYKLFLKAIENKNVIYFDGHLSYQSDMITEHNIKIDYFINIDKNMDLFFELTNEDFIHENKSHKKHLSSELYNFLINNNEYKKILDTLYKKDFDYFKSVNLE